ncbi:MAG: sensor histidine kinase [Lachnospirales bacterium]
MKRLSIKLRITIWFTFFIIILSVIILALLFFVSNNTSTSQTKNTLIDVVNENVREIEYDDGEIDIDNDFDYFKKGVNCLIYDNNGNQYSGYTDYDKLNLEEFEDGTLRTIYTSDVNYFFYDRLIYEENEPDIWLRGIVQENQNTISSSVMYQSLFIVLPFLIVFASVGGYFIAKHSLKPIKKISEMAEDIEKSGDLSKRIILNENKDELYYLALTFNNMFKQLENNFEAERNFTSDASHELRTPLTIILAQCDYAFENATNIDELYEAIGAIQKQGYRMSRLIETLLQFTRIEQNIEKIDYQKMDLSKIINSVCDEYALIDVKQISLYKNIEENIFLEANISLITRLVQNLVQNAFRYGKENGTINVSLEENSEYIFFSVKDNGIGISKDDIVHIWNRFYRVDKSRNDNKGLGLGLAMVKQIAEFHNGTVEVNSELDLGSTFTVKFYKNKN